MRAFRNTALLFSLVSATSAVAQAQPAPPAVPADPATPPTDPTVAPVVVAQPPVEAPPVEVKPPVADVKPPVADKPADAPPPKKLSVGTVGVFQPGMLAQGWLLVDHTSNAMDVGQSVSTFRLRRAEISAKGEILPHELGYQIMFDPAKVREFTTSTIKTSDGTTVDVKQPVGKISALQDFYITYLTKYADVSLGQFKIPVSWEGYNSSAKILFPERALVSSTFGDVRDLGVRVAKTFSQFGYSAGVFNGAGANNLDNNNQKDVALRLEAYPVKGLVVAGVVYSSVGYRARAGTKDRFEGDVRYESGPFLIQAEYLKAADVGASGATVNGEGYYVAGGYTIKDVGHSGHDLQPIVRFQAFNPNTDKDPTPAADTLHGYAVGFDYYLKGHEAKLQGVYEIQKHDKTRATNEFILAAQVWY